MIINSLDFNGKCDCGKEHEMTTRVCIISSGALADFEKLIKEYEISGRGVAIYDENTYRATEGLHPRAEKEIILPPKNLHADNHGVALALEQIPQNCDYLIAVGSGTIHDITRYCAYERKIPFVSCPTAASVDGFCSSVAAMTWDGFKKTFTAVAPEIVIADLDIIKEAPKRLTNSGFGDMIGKYIALTEWKIGNILTGEYICDKIYDLTVKATKSVLDSAEKINNKETVGFEMLVYGLLMSGLAMQLLGYSRCASGAEHHISHLIEMQPKGLGVCSDALHGEKVGVGTLITCREYYELIKQPHRFAVDYKRAEDKEIENIFAEDLSGIIKEENKNDCGVGITRDRVMSCFDKIADTVREIPTYEELLKTYRLLGLKETLTDIGVSEEKKEDILKYSPLVRNRLTLMRLRRGMEK